MSEPYKMQSYLIVVSKDDAAKLEANLESALHKISDTAYLASFRAAPEPIYRDLKEKYGIVGEILWIKLPDDCVTLTR